MPAKTTARQSNKETDTNAFIQDYLADWDDNDDPFASPSPEPGAGANKKNDKKRKEPDTLGIDEQIDLTKKARVPRVKLDETRLLSEKGIPALRKKAPKLRLKGKGHEFSDAARLLSFYQEWLDDLFPKATFLDALAMVEKTGHKTIIRNERLKWIAERKPKAAMTADDDDDPFGGEPVPRQPSRIAPIFENATYTARQGTPQNPDDDLFGDDDIYNATPRRDRPVQTSPGADVPDDDDLDALMAEAEASGTAQEKGTIKSMPGLGSIFGGKVTLARPAPPQPSGDLDDDDLDALMAEAEGLSAPAPAAGGHVSIFGGGIPKEAILIEEDDDDLDALMAEAEAQIVPPAKANSSIKETPAVSSNCPGGEKGNEAEKLAGQDDEDDELNALMAEAEGLASTASNTAVPKPDDRQQKGKDFEDDEEAMAEMDGLW